MYETVANQIYGFYRIAILLETNQLRMQASLYPYQDWLF